MIIIIWLIQQIIFNFPVVKNLGIYYQYTCFQGLQGLKAIYTLVFQTHNVALCPLVKFDTGHGLQQLHQIVP